LVGLLVPYNGPSPLREARILKKALALREAACRPPQVPEVAPWGN